MNININFISRTSDEQSCSKRERENDSDELSFKRLKKEESILEEIKYDIEFTSAEPLIIIEL